MLSVKWQWITDSLTVGLGASLGANGRFWLSRWVQSRTEPPFPWGTFWVNVTGCFGVGLIAGLMLGFNWSPSWRNLVIIGFLGGYTTFSSFSLETYNLLQRGIYLQALLNIVGSVSIGLLGTWAGDVISKLIAGPR